ncbi:hypothetical protein B296_00040931 [Ensete ventricosum]|uniref:Uncharacterized protein n=1 Tax=Ensete ventricosum TaxID=4639 RepID=A0A426X6J8_ENSVE|nr:hypothetical protein B296_00040931 [Ensete ventricosum]
MRLWQREEEDDGWPVVRTATADGRRQWPWPARDATATAVFWRRKRGQRSRSGLRRLQWQRKQGAGAAAGKEEKKITAVATVGGKAAGSRGDWRRGQRQHAVGRRRRRRTAAAQRGPVRAAAAGEQRGPARDAEEEGSTVRCSRGARGWERWAQLVRARREGGSGGPARAVAAGSDEDAREEGEEGAAGEATEEGYGRW